MWLFTKHGFFSAVCARQGNGKHGQHVDPRRIMVRARVQETDYDNFKSEVARHQRKAGAD